MLAACAVALLTIECAQACAGTIYLYPVYSQELGSVLGLSVGDMQTVGTLMNAGACALASLAAPGKQSHVNASLVDQALGAAC